MDSKPTEKVQKRPPVAYVWCWQMLQGTTNIWLTVRETGNLAERWTAVGLQCLVKRIALLIRWGCSQIFVDVCPLSEAERRAGHVKVCESKEHFIWVSLRWSIDIWTCLSAGKTSDWCLMEWTDTETGVTASVLKDVGCIWGPLCIPSISAL